MFEFLNKFKEVCEKEGISLEELKDMPTDTREEKRAFVDRMSSILDKVIGKDSDDLSNNYIKISGGKTVSALEAQGSTVGLLYLLAIGIAGVLGNDKNFKSNDIDEFLKLYCEEIKEVYKNQKEEK